MRSLILLRTHKATPSALAAFDRYSAEAGLPVVFVCDDRAGPVDVGGRARIGWDETTLDRLGLFRHPQAGWRCGDYAYYAAREAMPDYDRYWLIEPDVHINAASLGDFFRRFDDVGADFIGIKYGPKTKAWDWARTVRVDEGPVLGCVFSISRMSAAAVDALRAERAAASVTAATAENGAADWPNDEAFTANTLARLGFTAIDFNDTGAPVYSAQTFRNGAPFDRDRLATAEPDGLVYHPVRPLHDWLGWMARTFDTIDVEKRNQAAKLQAFGATLAETEATEDLALIPFMRALVAWERAEFKGWTGEGATSHAAKARRAETRLKQLFYPGKDRPRIGQAHVVTSLIRPTATVLCKPSDFERTFSIPVGRIPARHFLPYAFDFEKRRLLGTLHLQPAEAIAAPFIYGAQRERTRVVAEVRLASLDDLYGPWREDLDPIFVFSIGRVGSTLFNAMLRAAIPRAISEPGTLSQLPGTRKIWSEMQTEAVRRVFWHSISAFYATDIGVPDEGRVVLKLRSQVNAVADAITEHFPNATIVFVLRGREPWARSTFRAFRVPPENAARRLRQGLSTLALLKERAAKLRVISYEGILADPDGAIEAILGRPLTDEIRDQVRGVMAQDSQKGTGVSRERTGARPAEDEDAWVASFHKVWHDVRPERLINRLQLDY